MLRVRFCQRGKKNCRKYRLVVTEARSSRDGRHHRYLGWYDPYLEENKLHINWEDLHYWIGKGAVLSKKAKKVLCTQYPEQFSGKTVTPSSSDIQKPS